MVHFFVEFIAQLQSQQEKKYQRNFQDLAPFKARVYFYPANPAKKLAKRRNPAMGANFYRQNYAMSESIHFHSSKCQLLKPGASCATNKHDRNRKKCRRIGEAEFKILRRLRRRLLRCPQQVMFRGSRDKCANIGRGTYRTYSGHVRGSLDGETTHKCLVASLLEAKLFEQRHLYEAARTAVRRQSTSYISIGVVYVL